MQFCTRACHKKWQYLFEGKEKRDWDHFGFNNTALAKLPEFIRQDMAGVKKIHLSGSSDTSGNLVTGSLEPLEEEHQDIISRFTIIPVFLIFKKLKHRHGKPYNNLPLTGFADKLRV